MWPAQQRRLIPIGINAASLNSIPRLFELALTAETQKILTAEAQRKRREKNERECKS
jgi:hypothetical protein